LGGRLKYRAAQPSDLTEIQGLLESYDLPASDCREHLSNFIVAEENSGVIGVGGFQACGQSGLLRSFAVDHAYKSQGIAEEIFDLVKSIAIDGDIDQFYLLTTTASGYFERFGFSVCDRNSVPDSVKATKQFCELCPSTAVVMVLNLLTQE
jgi:amino-acid N-acetyltransferase